MAKKSLVGKNELRVGNFVLCKNKVTEVQSIYEQGINLDISGDYYGGWTCDYDGYFSYSWYEGALIEPIELTEEWLLKFGAKQLNKHRLMIGREFFSSNSKGEIFWERDYDRDERIEYVHQLQNLYFALTGNELTLTPAKEEMK